MTDQVSTAPAGWYAAPGDPEGSTRYWDGTAWTGSISPAVAPMGAVEDQAIDLRSARQLEPTGAPPEVMEDAVAVKEEPSNNGRTSPWKRILGRLIDASAYMGPPWILTLLLAMVAPVAAAGPVGVLAYLLLPPVIQFFFLTRRGTTPGKLLFGMAVVARFEAATEGHLGPLSARTAAKRVGFDVIFGPPIGGLFIALSSLSGSLAGIPALLCLASVPLLFLGRGRTVPDRVAGTVVVDAEIRLTTSRSDAGD